MKEKITELYNELFERYPSLQREKDNIMKAFEVIRGSYKDGGKLLVAGNGGSAADAEHIVGELMKGFIKPRKIEKEITQKLVEIDNELGMELSDAMQGALPAIAVVDHVALSTAFLNDVNPKMSFAQQINGYGNEKDVFLGITTSGNSENIIYASIMAKAKGMKVVGLTGRDGGKIKDLCDACIIVPEAETFKIQELHLPVYHTLCLMLEEEFF
ncbi:D-sedoheptulose-7-phosphate isomerase [Butyrivibrio fibrisolvens]|uniref:D-sedoheptulose-7-phosphate isomerase n=1 Tax=Butyrivibrio fibrisolvens TaxID=831 RepID=UPI000407AD7C|nr:SIS domain-containing protein [Butyrivibrio fibrisolvens]